MIDMFTVSIVSGVILAVFPVTGLMQNPQLLGLLMIGLMVPYEAVFSAAGFDLPGKQVMAIRVRLPDGKPLGFNLMFRRAMLVWVKGVALGLPLVSLLAMLIALNDLSKNKLSSWDRDCGSVVEYGEIGPGRKVIIATLLVLFGLLLVSAMQLLQQT